MKKALRIYLLKWERKINLIYRQTIRQFFRIYITLSAKRHIVASIEHPSLANYFCGIIGIAWLCEQMKVNLEFVFPKEAPSFFENSVLYNGYPQASDNRKFFINDATSRLASIARKTARKDLAADYGYKILSRLSIRHDIRKQVDEWFASHISGDWVAVHYRGTDTYTNPRLAKRFIPINSYIAYLKEVLDDHSSIFVCTDQAQFVDQVELAFPSRIYYRKIRRSTDTKTLHLRHDTQYTDDEAYQQKCDALMDILVLAKANLIYTTGSGFVEGVKNFNPDIKIISLDRRIERRSATNYLPIPKESLLRSLLAKQKNSLRMNS